MCEVAQNVHDRLRERHRQPPSEWRKMLGWSDLHEAAIYGRDDETRSLVAAGMDVNLQDATGRTPLHWAMWNDHPRSCTALIPAGASQSVCDDEGLTPWQYAMQYNGATACAAILRQLQPLRTLDLSGCQLTSQDLQKLMAGVSL
eukprot:Sspe_Gene.84135::Locus_55227_Transcript_1_1_Confidence_1.000_Length_454::g.84135::m.84135